MSISDTAGLLNRHCYQLHQLNYKEGSNAITVLLRNGSVIAHSDPSVPINQVPISPAVLAALQTVGVSTVVDGQLFHTLIPLGERGEAVIDISWVRSSFDTAVRNILLYSIVLFVLSVLVASLSCGYFLNKVFGQLESAQNMLRDSRQQLSDIIDFLPDATFVVDHEKKIIAWNRAVEKITGISKEEMLGKEGNTSTIPFYGERRKYLLDLLDTYDTQLAANYHNLIHKDNMLSAETFAPALYDGKGAHLWSSGAPLFNHDGVRVGAIEVIRDITDRKETEVALSASVEELQQTLTRVKLLEGIIPICMYCKQIRDDQNSWNQLEKYISDHSEAMFSHGICPNCFEEHFPKHGERPGDKTS